MVKGFMNLGKGFLNLGKGFLTMVENCLNKEVKNHRKDDKIKQGNRKGVPLTRSLAKFHPLTPHHSLHHTARPGSSGDPQLPDTAE